MPANPIIRSLVATQRECADCHAPSPSWASTNLAVFLCLQCAGIHRKLGVHISKVRSVSLDEWDAKIVEGFIREWHCRIERDQEYEMQGVDWHSERRMPLEAENDERMKYREAFIRSKWENAPWQQNYKQPRSMEPFSLESFEDAHDVSLAVEDDDVFKIDLLATFHGSDRIQFACEAPNSESNALVSQGRGIYEWNLADVASDDEVEKSVVVKDLPAPAQIVKFESYELIAYPIYTDMVELYHVARGQRSRVYTIRREALCHTADTIQQQNTNTQQINTPILTSFDLICKVSDSIMAVSSSSGIVVLSIKPTLSGEAPKVLTHNTNSFTDPIHILDALSDERIIVACGDSLYAFDWMAKIESQQDTPQGLWNSLWNKNTSVSGFFDSVRRNVSTFIENNVSSVPFATCLKHDERVTSFKALPDERFVVGTKNGNLMIYSNSGTLLHRIGSHDMLVRDFLFVGRYTLVTASRDFIRVWDFVHTGRFVQIPLNVDVHQLLHLRQSDDEFYIVTEHHILKYGITRLKTLQELGQEFSRRVQQGDER